MANLSCFTVCPFIYSFLFGFSNFSFVYLSIEVSLVLFCKSLDVLVQVFVSPSTLFFIFLFSMYICLLLRSSISLSANLTTVCAHKCLREFAYPSLGSAATTSSAVCMYLFAHPSFHRSNLSYNFRVCLSVSTCPYLSLFFVPQNFFFFSLFNRTSVHASTPSHVHPFLLHVRHTTIRLLPSVRVNILARFSIASSCRHPFIVSFTCLCTFASIWAFMYSVHHFPIPCPHL